MRFVEIYDLDQDEVSLIGLRHVLVALGSCAERLWWTVGGPDEEPLWAMGNGNLEITQLEESGERICGAALIELSGRISQVIWGGFCGFASQEAANPDVIIRAFDGCHYEVHSADGDILSEIRKAFRDVRYPDP